VLDPLSHLTGGLIGECDRKDAMRADAADVDEIGHPVGDYSGLTRSGARYDKNRAFYGLYSLPLGRIETG
jgi:hypothetical protein